MPSKFLFDTSTLLIRPRGALVLGGLMYLAAAFHTFILKAVGWPSMEVLWFAMLIPTIVLSFYYGRRGAFASVVLALALYLVVEVLFHDDTFASERVLFGASVLLAIVSLAIGIGALAELLRREYTGRSRAERAAATNEVAVALRHEIFNPLTALLAEIELLQDQAAVLPTDARASVESLTELAERIHRLVDRVAEIEEPKRVEYVQGTWMMDLSKR